MGNYCMESKIIEYGIILLHEYEVEQTEVISRLIFTFFTHIFLNIFILLSELRHHEFRKYLSYHTLKVYKALNQSVVKNIKIYF